MDEPWCILTDRYGADIRSPNASQIAESVRQLYHENEPGMTTGDYEEHAAACVRLGFDDGPMYVIEAMRTRQVVLSKYADLDFEELLGETSLDDVTEEHLIKLWERLAAGDLSALQKMHSELEW